MNRAQRIQYYIQEFFADDIDDMGSSSSSCSTPSTSRLSSSPAITSQDTVLNTVSKPFPDGIIPLCPTCGKDLIPGFPNPHMIQCPQCMTDVDLAYGKYPYRAHVPNRTRGQYGGGGNANSV